MHKTENCLRTTDFDYCALTAYMVRTGLNYLCVKSEKLHVHMQYASLSTSLRSSVMIKNL